MAVGVKRELSSDWSIAISGIAGPEGGSEEKPVGLVYIAIAGPENYTYTIKKITGKTPSENAEIILKKIEVSTDTDENPNIFFKTVKKHIEKSKKADNFIIQ